MAQLSRPLRVAFSRQASRAVAHRLPERRRGAHRPGATPQRDRELGGRRRSRTTANCFAAKASTRTSIRALEDLKRVPFLDKETVRLRGAELLSEGFSSRILIAGPLERHDRDRAAAGPHARGARLGVRGDLAPARLVRLPARRSLRRVRRPARGALRAAGGALLAQRSGAQPRALLALPHEARVPAALRQRAESARLPVLAGLSVGDRADLRVPAGERHRPANRRAGSRLHVVGDAARLPPRAHRLGDAHASRGPLRQRRAVGVCGAMRRTAATTSTPSSACSRSNRTRRGPKTGCAAR